MRHGHQAETEWPQKGHIRTKNQKPFWDFYAFLWLLSLLRSTIEVGISLTPIWGLSMANEFSRSSVHLDVNPRASKTASVLSPETPFRILVVGDFSGRANRQLSEPLAGRRAHAIDRDNFDTVVQKLNPSLNVGSMTLGFTTLDDFHPDQLFKRVPAFSKLVAMKNQGPQPSREATAAEAPAPAIATRN